MSEFATENGQPPFDEKALLLRARKGDRKAYGLIVEHYRERLYCAALGILRNHEDARDMSQDAFVRAFKALDRFELKRPFYPWLYRILRNRCLDYLERHGPRRKLSLDSLVDESHMKFAAEEEDPRERIQKQEMAEHLHAAIEELKPEFREIIIMKHLQEMPYKEIAEALDIPMGTVMSRLFHARKALAKLMEPHRPR
ncbi:sigma-70 family RNA polymerase sigma factor [bacterium]|nr:sigma-70 family RNA polymerase sigma factor [bacterium]